MPLDYRVKVAGYALLVVVVLLCLAALIGVILYSKTPCYKGALKSTGSHLLALRMASACNNDGKPWPLTAPAKFLPLRPATVDGGGESKSVVKKRQQSAAGWMWGSFAGAATAVIVAASVAYMAATRGKAGVQAMEQTFDHGQTTGALERLISNLNEGIPLSFDEMEVLAESGTTLSMAGVQADQAPIQRTMVELNNQGMTMDDQTTADTASAPGLSDAVEGAKAAVSAQRLAIHESAKAHQSEAVAFAQELEAARLDVSYVSAATSMLSSGAKGLWNGAVGIKDWAVGSTAQENSAIAEGDEFPYDEFLDEAHI